ncbi:HVO_0476 family zinc finger protein [Halobellus ordinarius]|uniref:HVO_0476 family zinc finger protein n=1 Tax=Halobellus ordinarius TaxID=3075120 RepID=UPI0028801886|nr:HVO_0476 family zinc finger protein [Halobellus sp. ZY16]
MSTPQDRLAVECPSCSTAESTVHEVLKEGGGRHTVKCTECGHVHKVKIEDDDEVERTVVISQDDESFSTRTDVPREETLAVGDEFIVDSEEAIMLVRITGLEIGPEQRADEAAAADVETIWTRAVDNVTVKTTVNPKEGTGDRESTRSFDLRLPGDHEFVVGETESFGDEEFRVKAIQVREDAPEYRHGKLDHEGDMVYAKDVKRLYGTDQTTSAWSAW